MSTYVLMRLLESAPARYDLGMRLLTLGRLARAYDRLARHVGPGQRVLDLGCGSGALALRAARNGARVKAVDLNAQLLEIAEKRARAAGLAGRISFVQMGVAGLDGEEPQSYDAVMSGLCFSELSADELAYALRQVVRILKPAGLLLVADEARPGAPAARIAHALLRAPLAAVTWLMTRRTSRPLVRLPQTLAEAGLAVAACRSSPLGGLVTLLARKPAGAAR